MLPGLQLLAQKSEEVSTLCQKHKVDKLYAFGSVLQAAFSEESDIDLLVGFKHQEYGQDYLDLKDEFETLFQKPVDLLTVGQLRNPYFIEELNRTQKMIYG
jgi:hypothetical protein